MRLGPLRGLFFSMDNEHIEYLRSKALTLVELARKIPDHDVAGAIEAIAIEMLKRALAAEQANRR